MLYVLLIALHILVSVILILVVLLQTGKGADLAGAFGGGGSQTAFGSRGAANFLTKMTTASAVIFMLTSISLAIISARGSASVLEQTGVPGQSVPLTTAAEPAATPTSSGDGSSAAAAAGSDASGIGGDADSVPTTSDEPVKAPGDDGTEEEAAAGDTGD